MYTQLAANDVGLHIYYIQTQQKFYTTNIQLADGTVATVQTMSPIVSKIFIFLSAPAWPSASDRYGPYHCHPCEVTASADDMGQACPSESQPGAVRLLGLHQRHNHLRF